LSSSARSDKKLQFAAGALSDDASSRTTNPALIEVRSKKKKKLQFADSSAAPAETSLEDSCSHTAEESGAFGVGKLVVMEVPRSAGQPWCNFKGEIGTVKSQQRTTGGFFYTVLFDSHQGPDVAPSCLDHVPEKWLRKNGALARSSDVKLVTIHEVLSGCRVHRIPAFQRRYCWTEQQWRLLWKSIVAAKDNQLLNTHSLGRIMVSLQADGSRLILDGQQRLTTLRLLLAALQHRAEALGHLLRHHDLPSVCDAFSHIPTIDDRPDFELCLKETLPEGQSAIVRAKRVFVELCSSLDAEGCEEMKHAVLSRVSVLCFTLENADAVQSVFENMARKAELKEMYQGSGSDLFSCAACFSSGEGGTVALSTHIGPDGHLLCAACAQGVPAAQPLTPGVSMSAVDLIRNFVLDHFGCEASMISIHNKYWRPLEHTHNHNIADLERAFQQFLEARHFDIQSRWALYPAFVQWWQHQETSTTDAQVASREKLAVMVQEIGKKHV
jgi:hypothetical protein